jgi:hypothetical protein
MDFVTSRLAEEKVLSEMEEVAGIPKVSLAIWATVGKREPLLLP